MADTNKRYSMFDLCKEYLDRYLCVRNYDSTTHEADFVGAYGSESMLAARVTFKDAEFFYTTPKGGYVKLEEPYSDNLLPGTKGTLQDIAHANKDSYIFIVSLMDNINICTSTAVFLCVTKDDECIESITNELYSCKVPFMRYWTGEYYEGVRMYDI